MYWSVIHGIKRGLFIGGMELVSLRCNCDFTTASSYGLGWYKYAIATQWYQFHTTDAWWFSLSLVEWNLLILYRLQFSGLFPNQTVIVLLRCSTAALKYHSTLISWMETFELQIIFHWNVFLMVWLICHHSSDNGCRIGDKSLSEPMMIKSTDAYMLHSASMS